MSLLSQPLVLLMGRIPRFFCKLMMPLLMRSVIRSPVSDTYWGVQEVGRQMPWMRPGGRWVRLNFKVAY